MKRTSACAVEQDNLVFFRAVDLVCMTQTEHMLGVFPFHRFFAQAD
ncbi:hypothetical protein [Nitrosospira multiformis]|nr:hypothetical protein [Nitrosospira multiformis]